VPAVIRWCARRLHPPAMRIDEPLTRLAVRTFICIGSGSPTTCAEFTDQPTRTRAYRAHGWSQIRSGTRRRSAARPQHRLNSVMYAAAKSVGMCLRHRLRVHTVEDSSESTELGLSRSAANRQRVLCPRGHVHSLSPASKANIHPGHSCECRGQRDGQPACSAAKSSASSRAAHKAEDGPAGLAAGSRAKPGGVGTPGLPAAACAFGIHTDRPQRILPRPALVQSR